MSFLQDRQKSICLGAKIFFNAHYLLVGLFWRSCGCGSFPLVFSASIEQGCFSGVRKHSQLIKQVKQQLVEAGAVARYDDCFYEVLERREAVV